MTRLRVPRLRVSTLLFITLLGCGDDSNSTGPSIPFGTPYDLVIPEGFPPPEIPEDNPLSVEGVELGRRLFFDPILSIDSTRSCASCHRP